MDEQIKGKIENSSNKKKKRFIFFGIGLMVFFTIVLGIISILNIIPIEIPLIKKPSAKQLDKKQEVRKIGFLYTMDPIIVNLADLEVSKYLKIRIEIEGNDIKINEEIDKRMPQIRDIIITLLSSKTFNEIYDREGKKRLKNEILQHINKLLGEKKVREIFFTEFVMQ
ncbi:MAG: flagellar basal body-associated FliL family protein [Candidatus Jordarchaeum sp.]